MEKAKQQTIQNIITKMENWKTEIMKRKTT